MTDDVGSFRTSVEVENPSTGARRAFGDVLVEEHTVHLTCSLGSRVPRQQMGRSRMPSSRSHAMRTGLGHVAERILSHAREWTGERRIGDGTRDRTRHTDASSAPHSMASAPRLPKHLRAALGDDAGADLVTILDEIRADRRHSERALLDQFARIDLRFDQMGERLDKMDHRFDRLEDRMGSLETRMGALEIKVGDVKADLMKWSFVFWVGAVGAIAALAGVLK